MVVTVAPSLMVTSPTTSTSISPVVLLMLPAVCVKPVAASNVISPACASIPLCKLIAPAIACKRTLPALVTLCNAVTEPPLSTKSPNVVVITTAPLARVVMSSLVEDKLAANEVASTRCTATVTSPTTRPLVSVINRPAPPALAATVVTAVLKTFALLPTPLPALNIRPFALIKLPPSKSWRSLPAISATLPLPAVIRSLVTVPVVASMRMSPLFVLIVVPFAWLISRVASKSIVWPAPIWLMLALINKSRPAYKLEWPAVLMMLPLMVKSESAPCAAIRKLPAALTVPVTVIAPVSDVSTKLAPLTTLSCVLSTEVEPLIVPSVFTNAVITAVEARFNAVCSLRYKLPVVASALKVADSSVNGLLSWAMLAAACKRKLFE